MLNTIEFLLKETQEELKLLQEYEIEVQRATKESEEKNDKYGCWYYMKWNKPTPRKSVIKDNLKMIRRLSIKFEKELDGRNDFGF